MIDIGKLNLNCFIWFLFDNEVLNGAGVESRTQESVRVESHFDWNTWVESNFDNWDSAKPIMVKPLPQSLKKKQANGQAASR